MMASMFKDVSMAPPIEVFALSKNFKEDPCQQKVDLGVGAYRTDEGKPWVLPVVNAVECHMASDRMLNHEYLPVAGMPDFCSSACKLVLGKESKAICENRVQGIQVLGGTGGLRLAAEFLRRNLGADVGYVSKPTWGNHQTILAHAGFSRIREYRYWDASRLCVDIDGLQEDLENAPSGAVVILHAVGHNPTGKDPSQEQWQFIACIIQRRGLFPLIDCAYQGFASGDCDRDAFVPRMFDMMGMDFFVSQSFSKNFGLYNERIGNLCIVASNNTVLPQIKSQMEIIVRAMWSNPCNHGARIVATVLNNPTYMDDWKHQVEQMAHRIQGMRDQLVNCLRQNGTPGSWDHIREQIGMFCYTGLTPDQVRHLKERHHVYMLSSGRISVAGLTGSNVAYVADAMHDAIISCPSGRQKNRG